MRNHIFALSLAVAMLAAPALGQVDYGGYLSLDYVKSGGEDAPPAGSIEDLLAGFLAAGRVGQRFGFALEVRARQLSAFELDQVWVGFLPSPAVTVKAGLYLVPFGSYNRAGRAHETPLISRPLPLEAAYPARWRDAGLVVEGVIGVLSYAGYVGRGLDGAEGLGAGQQTRDNNTDWAKGGRIGLALGSDIRVGASLFTGKHDSEGERDIVLKGVDVAWVTAQWEVHGEYAKGLIDNPEAFERGWSEGYAIWMLMSIRNVQPVGSFQKVKAEDAYQGGRLPMDRIRWTLGLRWVLTANVFLKLEYAWDKDRDLDLRDKALKVQAALAF